jgi:hypothetical protein
MLHERAPSMSGQWPGSRTSIASQADRSTIERACTYEANRIGVNDGLCNNSIVIVERGEENVCINRIKPGSALRSFAYCIALGVGALQSMPSLAADPPAPMDRNTDPQVLLDRIEALEKRLSNMEALEKRLNDLESSAVLSDPETRVKQTEVWIDKDGNESEQEIKGAKKTVRYQRERVYRRQTINEKIEEALASDASSRVGLGVTAAMTLQTAVQTKGEKKEADGNTYALASADLFFTADVAQNTSFYADVVGLSGSTPDIEIEPLTLLNGYTARLGEDNRLTLREAWIKTEIFDQKLALTFGRLDLTAFFDRNAAANDETTQFLSDALVNNPALGLSSNGAGVAAVYDSKSGFSARLGFQQSDPAATNLSKSIFSLAEVGYLARPFGLQEGNYRLWYRRDNSTDRHLSAFGISIDQKISSAFTLFGRFGSSDAEGGKDKFYSAGFQLQNGFVFNPEDSWGMGYARADLASGAKEDLLEAYYHLRLADRLALSFHLQHVLLSGGGTGKVGFLVPGLRLNASF